MIASFVMLAAIVALGAPAAVVVIPWTILTGNGDALYNAAQIITRAAFFLAGIEVETTGSELIPLHTACIFMSNHVSNLDPPALLPRIPGRTSVFIKRSLTRIPVLGYAFRLGELIPVDRDRRVESAQESVAAAKRVMAKGLHITSFVEGTRSPDGHLQPFKKGPFYLAKETGAPCIPVSIYGTETMMAKGSIRIRPGTAHVVFHAPIDPGSYETREQLMDAVRAVIAQGLPEWMRA